MPPGYLLDANLLVLYVVGMSNPTLITRHRRLSGFSEEDFELLADMLEDMSDIVVTPNVLTETSNLLGYQRDDDWGNLSIMLKRLIDEVVEVVIPSKDAAARSEFEALGLTDAGLLTVASPSRPLLTVDLQLCTWIQGLDEKAAINFTLLQQL